MRMILILKRESFSFANAKNSHLENFQKKAKAENAKAVFLPKPKLPKPILQKSQRRFFIPRMPTPFSCGKKKPKAVTDNGFLISCQAEELNLDSRLGSPAFALMWQIACDQHAYDAINFTTYTPL